MRYMPSSRQQHGMIAAVALFVSSSWAEHGVSSIEDMHTQGRVQGLFEVRQEARIFIAGWNSVHHTNFEASEPNLKSGATTCAVPMRVEWVTKNYGMSGINVFVFCDRVVVSTKADRSSKWKMVVPVSDPKRKRKH